MRHSGWIWILAFAIAMAAAVAAPASRLTAQEPIDVISDEPRNEFPRGVTFTLSFAPPASRLAEVRLRYELAPDGTGASAIANCNVAATANCTYTLFGGAGISIIPGAEITYHWEVEDEDGERVSTPEKVYVHEDTRFNFSTVSEGSVTVWYYSGDDVQANAVLRATVETLAEVGDLLETEVEFPVKVFLYDTAEEMQPAIVPTGGRGVVTLGEVVYSDTAMVSADVDALAITRHEIAHIVTGEATDGPFGIQSWLNEGISDFAQKQPLDSDGDVLERAVRNDTVLSMAQLKSSSARGLGSTVRLFYTQSGAIVRYLVETYGAGKFAALLRTFKEGATEDAAFSEVYGFDEAGLEDAWRESVGLPARSRPPTAEAGPTEQAAGAPTAASGEDGGAAATRDNDSDLPIGTIALVAALAVALAAAAGGVVLVVRDRM